MPITVPSLDDRRYPDLLQEAVARIPVHTPEWTNFNRSDPGMTLIELFAFLTETMLYRANRIPERNRTAFLSLLEIPLLPASSARGLVTVANETNGLGAPETTTLSASTEVDAGQVPFRIELGLDVLPVQSRIYYKRPVALTPDLQARYRQLYASVLVDGLPGEPPANLQPYETAVLDGRDPAGVDLVSQTVDGCLWVALIARPNEAPDLVRPALAGRVLSLGVVPVITDVARTLPPGGLGATTGGPPGSHLDYALPVVDAAPDAGPLYAVRDAVDQVNVLQHPGIVQITLPTEAGLQTWMDLDPLDEGVDAYPPAVDDPDLRQRIITWLRVRAGGVTEAKVLWAGVNAATVTQRATVRAEALPAGTGLPDQTVRLARAPVLPGSVRLTVTPPAQVTQVQEWQEINDVLDAGPEVPVSDPLLPPGAPQPPAAPSDVFVLDAEAGLLRFGDGLRGRRPPRDAVLRVDYAYGVGKAGNLGPAAITGNAGLPPGFTVTNPVRTWGGADAESVADGEKQIARYLQHRDRLVTAEDFDTITRRTPGVDIARVDVQPAYDPQLAPNTPGDAPGAVTLMVVPSFDPAAPEAPSPDRFAIDAICDYLDQRRLVTTELFVRGPQYVPIWVSVGVDVLPGLGIADVNARVAAELKRVLSPLPLTAQTTAGAAPPGPTYPHAQTGWPLRNPVTAVELTAYVTRVDGVHVVNELLLAQASDAAVDRVELAGLELPRVVAISVTAGAAVPLADLRGTSAPTTAGPRTIPVPAFPEAC
jgi:hypothetical protein